MAPRWLACALCLAPAIALAGQPRVPPAYVAAARAHGVPPVMLYALAQTESGVALAIGRRPWPWTLDIGGRARRFATRAAACRALRAALTTTRIVDVGLGQLNVRWQRALFAAGGRFADPCAALAPYANLDAAAALLHRAHDRGAGGWIAAAGRYHRPAGGPPAARYRTAFRAQLARLRHAVVFVAGNAQPRHPAERDSSSTVAKQTPAAPVASRANSSAALTWIEPQPAHVDQRDGLD